MASILLFCTRCWTGYASIGEVPVKCPACDRVTRWVTKFPQDRPTVPYVLSVNDAQFLKALKIDPELPPILERLQG